MIKRKKKPNKKARRRRRRRKKDKRFSHIKSQPIGRFGDPAETEKWQRRERRVKGKRIHKSWLMATHCHWEVQPAMLLMCFYPTKKKKAEEKKISYWSVSSSEDVAGFIWICKGNGIVLWAMKRGRWIVIIVWFCLFLPSISLTCLIIRFSWSLRVI